MKYRLAAVLKKKEQWTFLNKAILFFHLVQIYTSLKNALENQTEFSWRKPPEMQFM